MKISAIQSSLEFLSKISTDPHSMKKPKKILTIGTKSISPSTHSLINKISQFVEVIFSLKSANKYYNLAKWSKNTKKFLVRNPKLLDKIDSKTVATAIDKLNILKDSGLISNKNVKYLEKTIGNLESIEKDLQEKDKKNALEAFQKVVQQVFQDSSPKIVSNLEFDNEYQSLEVWSQAILIDFYFKFPNKINSQTLDRVIKKLDILKENKKISDENIERLYNVTKNLGIVKESLQLQEKQQTAFKQIQSVFQEFHVDIVPILNLGNESYSSLEKWSESVEKNLDQNPELLDKINSKKLDASIWKLKSLVKNLSTTDRNSLNKAILRFESIEKNLQKRQKEQAFEILQAVFQEFDTINTPQSKAYVLSFLTDPKINVTVPIQLSFGEFQVKDQYLKDLLRSESVVCNGKTLFQAQKTEVSLSDHQVEKQNALREATIIEKLIDQLGVMVFDRLTSFMHQAFAVDMHGSNIQKMSQVSIDLGDSNKALSTLIYGNNSGVDQTITLLPNNKVSLQSSLLIEIASIDSDGKSVVGYMRQSRTIEADRSDLAASVDDVTSTLPSLNVYDYQTRLYKTVEEAEVAYDQYKSVMRFFRSKNFST